MKALVEHIYIHVPFCTTKCGYCSFYSEKYSRQRIQEYLDILSKEINLYQAQYKLVPKTIYFGGGTPSLLRPSDISKILHLFPNLDSNCEITIEANPITLTNSYITELSHTKINRVSLGLQSSLEKNLTFLGRKHKANDVQSIIKRLREIKINNISLDLIYGIPNQSIADLQEDIKFYTNQDIEHISIYCLSIDEGSLFYENQVSLPHSDLVADMYSLIVDQLPTLGFRQYEISNFCKDNQYSIHNLSYWDCKNYLGLGPGAVGTINNIRYYNPHFQPWKDNVEQGKILTDIEHLDNLSKINEYIMLKLRLVSGLDLNSFRTRFAYNIYDAKKKIIDKYVEQGFLDFSGSNLSLTNKGKFVSNYIISDLLEDN